ncbi:hypothetical protein NKH61_05235 [Mesorhizobium sp. M1005]|uniref:hypothetical protein n=1 Tax=unclassified Mesorhizobium TaxID=325217 RepID=UPI00333D0291
MQERLGPAHLSYLQVQMQRPLTIFVPPLRRILPRQYVDAFWAGGVLRLSNFATFAKLDGASQRDSTEGHATIVQNDKESDRSYMAHSSIGQNAYVLSFTSRTRLPEEFGDAAMEIIEPIGFCGDIANMIPGCTSAMIGPCIYVDEKVLSSGGPVPSVEDFRLGDGSTNLSLNKVMAHFQSLQGPQSYFLKDRVYEDQSEFRMIWETISVVNDPLLINVPSLMNHCKKP